MLLLIIYFFILFYFFIYLINFKTLKQLKINFN